MSDSAIEDVLRHLRTRGALPVSLVRQLAQSHGVTAGQLAPHVVRSGGKLQLRLEADLRAGQLVSNLSFDSRVLLRSQADRLPLKVVGGQLCAPGKLNCTDRQSLLKAIQASADGVLTVDAVTDYPGAHADVIKLRNSGYVHAEGGRLWSHPGMRQIRNAGARWLEFG